MLVECPASTEPEEDPMRWFVPLAAILLSAACISVDATKAPGGPPPPSPPMFNSPDAAGTVVILETGDGNEVVVGYENTTAMTLKSVTIRCRGFDASGFQTGVEDIRIDGIVEGPIVPGFKIRRTAHVPPPLAAKITCGVTAAEASR